MTKEKVKSLQKYLEITQNKLNSAIPEKHKDHPATYKRFLQNEIQTVQKQLDAAKMDGLK